MRVNWIKEAKQALMFISRDQYLKAFFLLLILSVASLLCSPSTFAQTLSYDGNRWYEVEISIFTNPKLSALNKEVSFPAKADLSYPQPLLNLKPATASYALDSLSKPANALPSARDELDALEEDSEDFETEFSPARNGFRVLNFESDPFISLSSQFHQFDEINQDIKRSSDHKLLYHAVWRQPMLNKVQTSAIFIKGGDKFDNHNELEGSIRLSYNINRVDIDTQLWLTAFDIASPQLRSQWSLPKQPFPDSLQTISEDYRVSDVAFMNETRPMRSNEFHYLDHPEFGLIIQIRPYQLPGSFSLEAE